MNNPDGGCSFIADDTDKNTQADASSKEGYNITSDEPREDIHGKNGQCAGTTPAGFSGMTEYFNEHEERCRNETEPVIDHDTTNYNAIQSPTSNYYDRAALQIQEPQQATITEYANHTEVQDETPTEFPPPVDGGPDPCIPTDQAPVTNYQTTDCEKQLDKREDPKQEDKSGITDYESPSVNQEAGDEDDDIYGDVAGDDYEQMK